MPVQAAFGKVCANDQEIDIALSPRLPTRPGAEQDDTDEGLSIPGVQDAQETLQVLGNLYWQHSSGSFHWVYTATCVLGVSYPLPWPQAQTRPQSASGTVPD